MIKWRGEVSSTIVHMEKSLEKQEGFLLKLEDICRDWPISCEKHKAEIGAIINTSLTEVRENLREQIELTKDSIEKLEDQMEASDNGFAKQEDLDATNAIVGTLKDSVHKIPMKVAIIIIAILGVYEALQGVGLL